MFTNIENKGNPWGRSPKERATWIAEARRDGLDVPVIGEDVDTFDDIEYLFWVGCAGVYDEQGRRTTRAVIDLLHTAGVKFAVLSTSETCTGDPARRAGNEFLFQQQATANIDTLNQVFNGIEPGKRKIITTCPHCFNTIRNEYPDFDGHYDVFHHTQLLNRLVRDKRLKPVPRGPENRRPITYHDPCFLGRHNKVFDPPRELLESTGMELREMSKTRNEAFCCGAGGARMFMEETIGTRINEFRSEQALATGAEEIATGCPFCNSMFTSGVKPLTSEAPEVKDVATMLRDNILIDDSLPEPLPKAFVVHPTRVDLGLTPKPRKKPEPPQVTVPEVAGGGSGSSEVAAAGATTGATTPPRPRIPATPPSPGIPAAPPAPAAPTPSAPAAPAAPVAPAPATPPATPTPPAPAAPTPSAPAAPIPAAPAAPGTPTPPAVPSAPSVPPAPAAPAAPVPPAPMTPTPSAPAAPAPSVPSIPAPPPLPANPAPPKPPTPPTAKPSDEKDPE